MDSINWASPSYISSQYACGEESSLLVGDPICQKKLVGPVSQLLIDITGKKGEKPQQ